MQFFLLFLGYALTYCIFIAATTARHFINIWLLKKEESGEEEEEGEMQHSAAKYVPRDLYKGETKAANDLTKL